LAALVATALVAAAPFAADAQSLQCPETPFLRDGFEPAPTTPQPGTFDQRAGLDLINCARAQVVPPAIPPLAPVVWSNTIAADVQTRANSCSTQFDLSNGYGQVVVSGTLGANPIREAVDILIALRTQYDYANNACSNGLICRNYTQLVLRSATQAACAFAPCGGGLVWCFFDQIQNINVRPY
jgi:hypothetical protein